MFCSDRCVVSTLGQALDLAEPYPAEAVGVVVDTYHLWWDDQVWAQIARAGTAGRIACFQVADWITPLPEGVLLGRGLPGAGCIPLRRFREARRRRRVRPGRSRSRCSTPTLWDRPGGEVFAEMVEGYREHVEG